MATGPDDVCFQGKTRRSRPTTKMTRMTHSGHRDAFAEGNVMEYRRAVRRSVRLGARKLHHLGPLFNFIGEEPAKISR